MDDINKIEPLPDSPDEIDAGGFDFDVTQGFPMSGVVQEITPVEEASSEVVAEEVPTTEPEPTDRDISFTAKVDHKETQVSIKESEIADYYQKAQNMDRAVQRANEAREQLDKLTAERIRMAAVAKAALGIEGDDPDTILANMENGMTDTAVRSRAKSFKNTDTEIAEAHVRSTLKDTIDQSMAQFEASKVTDELDSVEAVAEEEPSNGVPIERFKEDLERLLSVRKDITADQFPTEVMLAYRNGANLFDAYAAYESKKTTAENEELRKQNAILQQNLASASKAPIRNGVSNTGSIQQEDDPWKRGFDYRGW